MSSLVAATTPSIDFQHEATKGFTSRYVRSKSREMVGHASLCEADRPDIEQYLLLAVWRAIPRFDPAMGAWESFVATVVERRADRILRRRKADRRLENVEVYSLDVLVQDEEGNDVSLASQIGQEHKDVVTGCRSISHVDECDLRHDVNQLMESVPARTRQVCSLLMTLSEREIAEAEGIQRRTVRAHMQRLREKAEAKEF